MTLLREYTQAVRSMLDRKEVTTSGRYLQLQNARLTWPPFEAEVEPSASIQAPMR